MKGSMKAFFCVVGLYYLSLQSAPPIRNDEVYCTASFILADARTRGTGSWMLDLFNQDRDCICEWFDKHKVPLERELQSLDSNLKVEIIGSLKWKTSHLLSDINAAVVTSYENVDDIFAKLQEYYKTHYPDVEQKEIKPQKGLPLFCMMNFKDKEFGEGVFNITVQSREKNDQIAAGVALAKEKKFGDNKFDLLEYTIDMMEAVINQDMSIRTSLKRWMNVKLEEVK